MDNRTVANWLLCEGYSYLSETFKDMGFPIKVHTNIIEIAKNFVTDQLSKLSDSEFQSKINNMKDFGASEEYLKAKNKEQLIAISRDELDVLKPNKTNQGHDVKGGIMTFANEQDFAKTLYHIYKAIGIQVEEELGLDLSESKFQGISSLSRLTAKPEEIYNLIASNPKVYGTIAKV